LNQVLGFRGESKVEQGNLTLVIAIMKILVRRSLPKLKYVLAITFFFWIGILGLTFILCWDFYYSAVCERSLWFKIYYFSYPFVACFIALLIHTTSLLFRSRQCFLFVIFGSILACVEHFLVSREHSAFDFIQQMYHLPNFLLLVFCFIEYAVFWLFILAASHLSADILNAEEGLTDVG
jgi:hypothetical protein